LAARGHYRGRVIYDGGAIWKARVSVLEFHRLCAEIPDCAELYQDPDVTRAIHQLRIDQRARMPVIWSDIVLCLQPRRPSVILWGRHQGCANLAEMRRVHLVLHRECAVHNRSA